MNWKKGIRYLLLLILIMMVLSFIWISRDGKRMYGGLTVRVDHEQFKPFEGTFVIQDVSILAPDAAHMIPGMTVLIEEGVITAVDSSVRIPSGAYVVDGAGKYLIPGLIDTHVHLFQSPNDLLLYLANGVTEIRELIGEESHLQWKEQIENGRIGPRMFVASPRLGSFDRMTGWFMSWSQGYMNIRNAEEARESVKHLHELGFDGLKVYSQINRESYLAILETAKSLEMPVFGHVPWELELKDVWQNGQCGIAHFEELMNALQREFGHFRGKEEEFLKYVEQRSGQMAQNIIKNDIAVTSTLWLVESFVKQKFDLREVLRNVELAYQNPGISEWVSYIPHGLGWLPQVNRYKLTEGLSIEEKKGIKKYWETYARACQLLAKNLADKGVKIMAGTDANLPPTVPGFSLHDELVSLNRAGMSNQQVLQSATSIPAQWLKSNSGKIVPGYDANLILLDKNPLVDISNTKKINMVIANGSVFDRDLLDQILAAVKQANDSSREVDIVEYSR